MEKYNKYLDIKSLSKIIGLIIGTAGIIIGVWDKLIATYFIVVGIWLYLICGEEN